MFSTRLTRVYLNEIFRYRLLKRYLPLLLIY